MPSLLQRQIFKEIANLFVLAVGVLLTLILISHHLSGERERQFDQVYRMQPCQQAGTR